MVSYVHKFVLKAEKPAGLNPCCSGRWSRTGRKFAIHKQDDVLILVVVDDGLVQLVYKVLRVLYQVLILVVVDDGLVQLYTTVSICCRCVLILVVVDDGLVLMDKYNVKELTAAS